MLILRRFSARAAAVCAAALALAAAGLSDLPAVGADQADASYALGCTFNAYAPWSSGGRVYANLRINCDRSRSLIVRGRVTRHKTLWPDKTVGSYDSWVSFTAGQWKTIQVSGPCDGGANYFAKAVIQESAYSTAYTDKSALAWAC